MSEDSLQIDSKRSRFPYSIVWTPLPVITWIIPFIGHMGIATSGGIIRDFAGPYFVSEDNMAFGEPTKYWQLDVALAANGKRGWDEAVSSASSTYCHRMHNIFCDNCHSHVSLALNLMNYNDQSNYNMFKTFCLFTFNCKYVSFYGFLKTWLPFLIVIAIITAIVYFSRGI